MSEIYCSHYYYVNKKREYFPLAGFYPSTIVHSRFPPKIQFLYCLLSSLALNLGLQFPRKCISDTFFDCRCIACTSFVWSSSNFSWNLQFFIRSFQEKLTRRVKLKRLSVITQFKIEFLLPFTGCRKVLRKMPTLRVFFLCKRSNKLNFVQGTHYSILANSENIFQIVLALRYVLMSAPITWKRHEVAHGC